MNYQSGAKSPMSSVFSGIFVFVAMFTFGSLAAHIPLPALAGVVIVIALGLVDIKEMRRIGKAQAAIV